MQKQATRKRLINRISFTSIVPASIWIPIGRFLSIIGGFVGLRVLTEIVSPEQYGRLSLITGLVSLVSLVLYTSLGKSVTRYIWDYTNESHGHVWVVSSVLTVIVLGMVSTLILWVALASGINLNLSPDTAAWTVPVFLTIGGLSTTLLSVLNILQEHAAFVVGTTASVWLKAGVAIFAALLIAPTAEAVMMGYAVSTVPVLLGALWITWRRGLLDYVIEKAEMWSAIRRMTVYALPFVVVHTLYWSQTTANRYVLNMQLGVDQVGIFVVAVTVARLPIQSIESIFSQIHQPVLYRQIGQTNGQAAEVRVRQQAYSNFVLSFFIITLPVLGFTALGADYVIRLFAGQSYWQGAKIIPWVSLAEFLRAFTAVLSIAFEIEKRPRSLIFPVCVSSIVTILLTIILSKPLGIIGAGIALAIGGGTWLFLTWIPASQLPCWNIPWPKLLRVAWVSIGITAISWFVQYIVHDHSFMVKTAFFVVAFGISYMLYAGQRILGVDSKYKRSA